MGGLRSLSRRFRVSRRGASRTGDACGRRGAAGPLGDLVGGEAARDEAGSPAGDEIKHPGARDPADHLGGNVAGDLVRREPLAAHEAHGDRGVEHVASTERVVLPRTMPVGHKSASCQTPWGEADRGILFSDQHIDLVFGALSGYVLCVMSQCGEIDFLH